MQGCSPRDRGLGLECSRSREHSRPILCGLGLGLERQGLGLGLDTYSLGLGLGLEGSVSKSFKTSCVCRCVTRN